MSADLTNGTPLVYGREQYIDRLWQTLDGDPPLMPGRSIYINDLRRIGKTYILDELERNPRGYIVVNYSVEGLGDASRFAATVFNSVRSHLSTGAKVSGWITQFVHQWRGASVDGVLTLPEGSNAPWIDILRKTFEDLQSALDETNQKIVFLWDELPDLMDSIINNETEEKKGVTNASGLLGILRSARDNYPRIRMVFTGSIGMHHILAKLRRNGYKGEPLNDMAHMPPGPLSPEDGVAFASALLTSAGVRDDARQTFARKIASLVGNIPFYIKGLAQAVTLDLKDDQLTSKHIADKIKEALMRNDWELRYFHDRIKNAYGEDTSLVLGILDTLAVCDSLLITELVGKLPDNHPLDVEYVRHLLTLLEEDHYLTRSKKEPGGYLFRYDLIRRWWCVYRGLVPAKTPKSTR